MSKQQSKKRDIRTGISTAAERHNDITMAEVVAEVSDELDCPEAAVKEQIEVLERHGFVYLVGDGAGAEVRVP